MKVPAVPPRMNVSATKSRAGHAPPHDWRYVEVDVREDLRNGREPFTRIMSTVEKLGAREVLHLRAIFEPVPLYNVLGKRGLVFQTEKHSEDDWSIWFWRDATGQAVTEQVQQPVATSSGENVLDVRGLEPPEPMVRTLAALESLPEGGTLVQVNIRVPQLLLPMLEERGFEYAVVEEAVGKVLVRIRRATNEAVTVL